MIIVQLQHEDMTRHQMMIIVQLQHEHSDMTHHHTLIIVNRMFAEDF